MGGKMRIEKMKAFSIKDVGEAYEKGYIAGQADLIKILKSDGQPEIAKVVEQYVDMDVLGVKGNSLVNATKTGENSNILPRKAVGGLLPANPKTKKSEVVK